MTITIKKDVYSKRIDFTVNGRAYHTDKDGEGLWEGTNYGRQIEGLAQFKLTQKTVSGIRKAIERKFYED